jgi:hypothetical protein
LENDLNASIRLTSLLETEVSYIRAIEVDATGLDLGQSKNCSCDSRFPGAGLTHQANRLAGTYLETDTVENGRYVSTATILD